MITKRDWWIGVGAVVLALLVHAWVPRYEWRTPEYAAVAIRIDRWTGAAELGSFRDGLSTDLRSRWEPLPETTADTATADPDAPFILRGPPADASEDR